MTGPGGHGGSILRFGPLDETNGLLTPEDRDYHRGAGRRFLARADEYDRRAASPEPGDCPDDLRAMARKFRRDGTEMLERADRVAARFGAAR